MMFDAELRTKIHGLFPRASHLSLHASRQPFFSQRGDVTIHRTQTKQNGGIRILFVDVSTGRGGGINFETFSIFV